MTWWIVAIAAAAFLFALAWWSSGRAKGKPGRPDAQAEADRGWATDQSLRSRTNGQSGGM